MSPQCTPTICRAFRLCHHSVLPLFAGLLGCVTTVYSHRLPGSQVTVVAVVRVCHHSVLPLFAGLLGCVTTVYSHNLSGLQVTVLVFLRPCHHQCTSTFCRACKYCCTVPRSSTLNETDSVSSSLFQTSSVEARLVSV